jgi:hypothetical protein
MLHSVLLPCTLPAGQGQALVGKACAGLRGSLPPNLFSWDMAAVLLALDL